MSNDPARTSSRTARASPTRTRIRAAPDTVVRGLCEFLGVTFEPAMLDYGRFEHDGFTDGLGDSSLNIRSGRIQPPTPIPDEVPAELSGICATLGY